MLTEAANAETDRARLLAELKARIAVPVASGAPLLPYGIEAIDARRLALPAPTRDRAAAAGRASRRAA
ncbi:hypothetical protein ACFQ1E_19330 [Sphingomonas canadensis]|uniref:Uncharacterized protein n=1 Tax=Sphingomonas canadensis TaxID=1219257 RepID=A0ABW3HB90_9SPHN|nr:hypothetical protein [Sphingomonas canadensis]MCW3838164.1 hypothetical protein [Sphingomonas canadensis]